MSNIDPITLCVIQAGLQQVCDEMDLTFSRSAFSPVIAEADDRSDGIYDAETGELIAQGELGLPVFRSDAEAAMSLSGSQTPQRLVARALHTPSQGSRRR